MTVSPRQTAPRPTPRSRRRSAVPWLAPAALAVALAGCSTGGLRSHFSETATCVRVHFAAEKAYLHRGDLFHECCSHPLDFKHGFKNGYRDVALYGDDCCAPPTPPSCYWGCCTDDPCERVERLNCYYDGWAHGAIAAGQDGVAGLNTVPIRNICGGIQPAGAYGPMPYADPGGFDPYQPDDLPEGVAAPAPDPFAAEQFDPRLPATPVPAPAPLPVPPDPAVDAEVEREGSVGGSPNDDLLEELLDADRQDGDALDFDTSPEPRGAAADGAESLLNDGDSTTRRENGFRTVPSSDDGPRVTTLWSSDS
ncbi:hypothetical protein [Alienimonas sp. DA493]|uniref:hypothetical protein n=1 Tax=Alienimonas sp. DA493 TaxID=3373605 RepID=UPI003754EAB4